MTPSRLEVLARGSAGVVGACGKDPSAACRFVFDHTSDAGLAKFADFVVARPLKIVMICLVAWILARVCRRLIGRFVERLAGSSQSGRISRARQRAPNLLVPGGEPSVRSAARAATIGQVLRSLSSVVIYTFAAMYVVAEFGLQLAPLIAGAGVAGVAIGFGAQSLVKDFLSGMFMLIEDQYGVGDVIDCGVAVGTVEAVSLRTTRLRDLNGTVWHVPNGTIQRVGNQSQQWGRAVVDTLVATGTDIERAKALLLDVAQQVCADPAVAPEVLEPPEVWGTEMLGPEGVTLRMVVKTRPASRGVVMRALRTGVHDRLAAEGEQVPAAPGTIALVGPPPEAGADAPAGPEAESVDQPERQ